MADDHGDGNGNRATVAMVLREVATTKELMAANFETVHVRLDALAKLPDRVDVLETRVDHLDTDVGLLKTASVTQARALQDRRAYRMGTLPMIVLTFFGLLLAGVNAYAILAG